MSAGTRVPLHWRGNDTARWAIFPIAVLVLFVTLVGLDLSGSSIAAISTTTPAPGLLAGEPRTIRSDEFQLRTPIAISSTLQGFPSDPWIGLTPTAQASTAHGGPTAEWSAVLKPQEWGYHLLGASRGLAWSWWWSFAASLWGVFALLGILTRRPGVSAALAVVATFTPYSAWWSAPPPSLFVGYAALTGAALLASWIATTRARRYLYAIAAGLSGAVFALALYPPWQVSLVLVVAATCLGYAADRRLSWRTVLVSVAVTAAVAGLAVGAWFAQHLDAIGAVVNTDYPGQRVTLAGTGSLSALSSAPLNFWMTGPQGASLGTDGRGGPFSNLSEISSSWFPLPLVALLCLGVATLGARRLATRRPLPARERPGSPEGAAGLATLSGASAAIIVLLAWTFIPLPSWVGSITMLDTVQPSRTPLALGFGFVILLAVAHQLRKATTVWHPAVVGCAVIASAAVTAWAVLDIPWDRSLMPAKTGAIAGLVLAALCAWAFYGPRRTLGAAALACFAFVSWALVNPLQQGIAPLTEDPLARELRTLVGSSEDDLVVVFGGFDAMAKVRAAGFQVVSGVTMYPDVEIMESLFPGDEDTWNSYMQNLWEPAPEGSSPSFTQVRGTLHRLTIDPCDDALLSTVGPSWVVTEAPVVASCLTERSQAQGRRGVMHIYEVAP